MSTFSDYNRIELFNIQHNLQEKRTLYNIGNHTWYRKSAPFQAMHLHNRRLQCNNEILNRAYWKETIELQNLFSCVCQTMSASGYVDNLA